MKLLITLPLALSALASASYTLSQPNNENYLSARGIAMRPKCMDKLQPHPPQWCLTMYQRRLWCSANEDECEAKRPWLHKKLNNINEPGAGRKHGKHGGKHGKHGHGKRAHGGKHGKGQAKPPKMRNLGIPNDPFPAPEAKPAIMLDPKPSPIPKFQFHESVHGGDQVEKRDVAGDTADTDEDDQADIGELVNDPEIQASVNDGAWDDNDDDAATNTDADETDSEATPDPPEVYMDEFEPDDATPSLQRRGHGWDVRVPLILQPACLKRRISGGKNDHKIDGKKIDVPLSPGWKKGPVSNLFKGKGISKQCKIKTARRIWCYKNPGRCYHFHRKFFMEEVRLLRKAKAAKETKDKGVGGKPEGRPAPGTRPLAVPKHEGRPAPGTRPHALAEPPNGGVKFHKGITGYGGRPNPQVLPGGVLPKVSRRDLDEDEDDDEEIPEVEVDHGDDTDVDLDESEDEADEGIDTDTDDGAFTDGDYSSSDEADDIDDATANNTDNSIVDKRDIGTMIREIYAENGKGVRRTPLCYRKYKKIGKEDEAPEWCKIINDRRHKCLDKDPDWCKKTHPWLWKALHGQL